MNLAARAGRFSASHRKTAVLGWLALVAVAVVAGGMFGSVKQTSAEQTNGGAARAERMLAAAGFDLPAGETVVIGNRRATAGTTPFAGVIADVRSELRRLPQVRNLRGGGVSKDGHLALLRFDVAGDSDTAGDRIGPVLKRIAALQRLHPSFAIGEAGDASFTQAANDVVTRDLSRAETLSVPVTFLILLLAFGAFVAAGLPVLLAFSAVLGAVGLGHLASHLVHEADATSSVIVLMGMAVGVDYSLFYVRREREERRRGADPETALHRAAATSGRAVLVSGLTVITAAAGMTLSGSSVFTSLGLGTILVVFLAMVGSLTVLPALLAVLGDRIDRGVVATTAALLLRVLPGRPRVLVRLRDRRTILQRLIGTRAESRVWGVVLRPALRYPKITALGSIAILGALAAPAFHLHTRNAGVAEFPKNLQVVRAYDSITSGFGAAAAPAVVVVRAPDVDTPGIRGAIAALGRASRDAGISRGAVHTTVNPSRTVARVDLPLAGNGDNEPSVRALGMLRSELIPATIGRIAGAEVAVTGETAGGVDFATAIRRHLPLVFGFVLLLTFGLMLVCFRSLVVALTAIVLNSLSLAAAYGVITWIFQDGHLERQLHFHADGAIVPWVPLFLFTVLFGLSMDYHVFIVSRIRELRDRGVSTAEAVERGIKSTASTVTSAAFVMVAVFAIFATLDMLSMKEMGVGLAAAVLLDATVIRGLLLPATMKLLGEWNWYLPRAMGRLPRLDLAAERA